MKNFTIKEASVKYSVSELCIWGLIRQKLISSTFSKIRKEVIVQQNELAEYMEAHQEELKVWQKRKKWQIVSEGDGETVYTNGIKNFSDLELQDRIMEMQERSAE